MPNWCENYVDIDGSVEAMNHFIDTYCEHIAADTYKAQGGALTTLDLEDCTSLTYPPDEIRGNVHKTVGFCCLNLLEGGDVSDDLKRSFVSHLVSEAAHDERREVRV